MTPASRPGNARYKKPRPCCARPTPTFFITPQECISVLYRFPGGSDTVEYEGSTWCPQCKTARHTFRKASNRRLQTVVVPPNAVRT